MNHKQISGFVSFTAQLYEILNRYVIAFSLLYEYICNIFFIMNSRSSTIPTAVFAALSATCQRSQWYVPAPAARLYPSRRSSGDGLRPQLWSYQYHHSSAHNRCWSMPRLPGWNSRRWLHMSRYPLRYSLLPSRNSLLSRSQKQKMLELRCFVWIDEWHSHVNVLIRVNDLIGIKIVTLFYRYIFLKITGK